MNEQRSIQSLELKTAAYGGIVSQRRPCPTVSLVVIAVGAAAQANQIVFP
jgi:hypothetical protein